MAIESTLLYREVAMITGEGAKPVMWQWVCTIHVNGKDIKPLFTNEVEIERNYIEQYCPPVASFWWNTQTFFCFAVKFNGVFKVQLFPVP